MSIETAVYDAIKAICPRVYPDIAPAGTAAPYVVYQAIAGRALSYTSDEVPNLRNAEMQISVWATTRTAANALSSSIEAALIAITTIQARPSSGLAAQYDEDADLRGAIQTFSIWGAR